MMCMYNDRQLPDGVGVLGYTVSTPNYTAQTTDIPRRRGLIRTSSKLGNRAVMLRMAMIAGSLEENAALLRDLNAWCYSPEPAPLILPGMEDRYLLAECDTYPTPDLGEPWKEFQIAFTCHVPEYISLREQRASTAAPFVISGTVSTPVIMTFVIGSELQSPVWTIDESRVIQLTGEIPAGVLVVDTERGKVTLDGEDITDDVVLTSDIDFELLPGVHTVDAAAGVSGTVAWHDRWI